MQGNYYRKIHIYAEKHIFDTNREVFIDKEKS